MSMFTGISVDCSSLNSKVFCRANFSSDGPKQENRNSRKVHAKTRTDHDKIYLLVGVPRLQPRQAKYRDAETEYFASYVHQLEYEINKQRKKNLFYKTKCFLSNILFHACNCMVPLIRHYIKND